ncbi:MAG: GCN5-related N-acetyltransferase, partial [Marmoricola sp.]|nr:GCN5-related N-acetyltransferase [Marmoricola sp.]
MTDIEIRALTAADWPAVERIYAAGIATGHATFEGTPPTWESFDASKLQDQRLVAVEAGTVIGWAAASPVSDRCVYAGVVEHSVYVAPDHRGGGTGLVLLEALTSSTERAGIWTIQSGIFPENTASLAVHRRAGFHVIGTRTAIGR